MNFKIYTTVKVDCEVTYSCNDNKILEKIINLKNNIKLENDKNKKKELIYELGELLNKCQKISEEELNDKYDCEIYDIE